MARYTGPKCKLCRRERTKLFLKGVRCLSPKCAVTKRNTPPGERIQGSRMQKLTDYGRHLREKQKVKKIYGLLERQFRKYFEEASRKKGVTGDILLQLLERRLDSIICTAGVAASRSEARRRILDGEFLVNGKLVNIPSYLIKKEDVIVSKKKKQSGKVEEEIPAWIKLADDKAEVKVIDFPKRDDIKHEIKEELIVEYYSR